MTIIQAGDLDKNLELQPNDTVFVPRPEVFVTARSAARRLRLVPGDDDTPAHLRRGRPHAGRLDGRSRWSAQVTARARKTRSSSTTPSARRHLVVRRRLF